MAKTIFITGASRGFGQIWTEAFLKRGDNVVAAARNPETLTELTKEFSSNLLVLKLGYSGRCDQAIPCYLEHRFVLSL